ncbi:MULTISPECIES: hypothetical protein [Metallosphaera]|uniref:Uncharacterized protein n=3 Tax=Sulfolobaceae TaxID=118883 RepID=A4YIQ8_METS5|nr:MULTISPECIES: hypothetical protein [Metallosphaera]ABP96310.1 hypothetical protein Msed_2171 [Metallosphaera sedula DSM 5348]AIM28293.1 hypothetical protein HA72_2171 [Metallosphaera sedula]MCH1770553.1 hypothetical protein [Metallosphaera sedula]MCP6728751.1 hypothetical protein [Metallosphaera sedula]MCY0861029.1 hypothetical protein [Metallosphaera prunae]
MNLLELILFAIGLAMFPYGMYEVVKGDGTTKTKLTLIVTSLTLFIVESILVFR